MRAAAMVDDGSEFEKHIPIAVRETRSLFRLTPCAPAGARARRVEAIVAADSAEEARTITSLHDPHGNDWGSELFASCSMIECIGAHVHGDIVFLSIPAPRSRSVENGKGSPANDPVG
jgi:hypothetical protein